MSDSVSLAPSFTMSTCRVIVAEVNTYSQSAMTTQLSSISLVWSYNGYFKNVNTHNIAHRIHSINLSIACNTPDANVYRTLLNNLLLCPGKPIVPTPLFKYYGEMLNPSQWASMVCINLIASSVVSTLDPVLVASLDMSTYGIPNSCWQPWSYQPYYSVAVIISAIHN